MKDMDTEEIKITDFDSKWMGCTHFSMNKLLSTLYSLQVIVICSGGRSEIGRRDCALQVRLLRPHLRQGQGKIQDWEIENPYPVWSLNFTSLSRIL